ncbi:MAG: MlaE family lipid ABC transporter permease subunit [Campylobacteraceae bacterium]|nr:MlaE family lipid ABC transporter permease subunit [Campylobacteraceae bacterium]
MPALFTLSIEKETLLVKCSAEWLCTSVEKVLECSFETPCSKVIWDMKNIIRMDTAGAMAYLHVKKKLEKIGKIVLLENASKEIISLLKLCELYEKPPTPKIAKSKSKTENFLLGLADASIQYWKTTLLFLSFVGQVVNTLGKSILNPKSIRYKATLYHMEQNGLRALPIVAITALLIGVVMAYQGAVQLEKFGANIFIVEMVGISVTRELAPLIVAIVVAGRSSSAFTAQIGVMKITDEIDAMRTMGFGPWEFLVLPRVIALMIVLPLLVLFGDGVAIFGGMIIAQTELGISMPEFMDRFQETVALKHTVIGLIKAPVFGAIIALIGCYRGFEISGSTESVGKYTTISVVNAVFWVIAFDAIFSVLLTEMGL